MGRSRGAALILVVVVIAALVAIAAPFIVSMRLHEKSARGFASRIKARRLAEGARNDAVAALLSTHPDEERRQRLARQDANGDDEDWDSLDELSPRTRDVAGQYPLDAHGTRTTMLDAIVRDERSKVDLNGCGAEPIANLLAVTVTTDALGYDEKDFLPLEDVRPFYSDGDRDTLDGIVRVHGEFIGYRDVSASPPGLRGLVRGMFFTRNPPPDDADSRKTLYPEGTLVQDFRGWKVAWDPIFRWLGTEREGELARFETPSAIRKIADWDFGTFAAAYYFHGNGVTFDKLREWGVARDKLERAGLDPANLDEKALREKEDADLRKRREAAEEGLRRLGVDPAKMRRFGGDRAVLRAWELLETLEPDQRESLAKGYRDRAAKLEEQELKHEDFWRGEVKRQLDELIALREKTPELEAIGRIELERIRPYLTVDAAHDGEAWTDPQVVNHEVRYEPYQPFCRLRVQDGRRFRGGALVRVRPLAGGPPEFRRILSVGRGPDHAELRVFPQLERDYRSSEVEVAALLPKPVNVNAAPREVLVAVLTGLQTRLFQKASATGRTAPNFVTPTEAGAIADRILGQPLRSHLELKALLDKARDENVIDQGDVEAILENAVDPGDANLTRATVPFCYGAGDVYEVTATGIVNDEQANEVARVRTREVVQVAPPRDLVWNLDSQADLQDRIATREQAAQQRGAPPSLVPVFFRGRWSHLLETFPVDVLSASWLEPDRRHAGPGELRLVTGRDWDQPQARARNPGGTSWADFAPGVLGPGDHFDTEREGHELASPFVLPQARLATRSFALEDATPRKYLGPGSVRAWFKVDRLAGGRTYFFDAGQDENRDRISLCYDGGTKELVATVRDESLDLLESGGKPRPTAEVRAPVTLRPENWYHVALAWKGSERGDLAMLLDGRPVGRDGLGTRLSGPIDATALVIPVESTAGFPDHGWIRVGGFRHPDSILGGDVYTYRWSRPPWSAFQFYGEVLYYESKTATSFNVVAGPNDWGVQWHARHDRDNPPRTAPPEAEAPVRQPARGTGRYTEIADPGYLPFAVRRGAEHETGAIVQLWGYTSWLKNGPNWVTRWDRNGGAQPPKVATYQETLRPGRALLLEPIPENTPFTMVYRPNPPGWVKPPAGSPQQQRPVVVQPTDTEIPVIWAAPFPDPGPRGIGGWPKQGIIRIGNERMFYRDLIQDPSGDFAKFVVPLQDRGLDGTLAQPHHLWEAVALESIRISSDQDYPDRRHFFEPEVFVQLTPPLSPGVLQSLQDPRNAPVAEWYSILKCDPPYGPEHLLVPTLLPDAPVNGQTLVGPDPNGTTPRFVRVLPRGDGIPWVDVHADPSGLRWRQAMIDLFNQANGRLPRNPGNAPVTVTPATPPPPTAGGNAGAAPLAPQTLPLKEWLKSVDPSWNRAQKGTGLQTSGQNATSTSAGGGRPHAAGEKVIPTFYLGPAHPSNGAPPELAFADKGDVVTVCDDQDPSAREERTITWRAGTDAGTMNLANGVASLHGEPATGAIVALDDFVARPYAASAHARIVKYPSGQLPLVPQEMALGGAGVRTRVPGPLRGRVDEVVTTQEDEPANAETQVRSGGSLWPGVAALTAGDTSWETWLRSNANPNNPLRGGVLVRFDDELVGVHDVFAGANGQGVQVLRGLLGTAPAPHGAECAFWWNFPFPRMAVAQTGFTVPLEEQLPIRPRSTGPLHDRDFFVAVDRGRGGGISEILPIRAERGWNLHRPRDRFDRGAFRGAFGTAVAGAPAPGEVLFDWPFRFQDRYNARLSSIEGVFFEATREVQGAFFESVSWDATLPNAFTRVLVAARVDGSPSWDDEPAKKTDVGTPNKLFLFDDPKGENKLLVRGNRIELRVYVQQRPQAFQQDAWKQTPVIKGLRVTYRQPLRILRREELLE